jgi:hypothetical protein
MASFNVETYQIIQSNLRGGYGWIMLFSASGGKVNRARLDFVPSGEGSVDVGSSMVTVAMHISSFDRVIDTLRNEKPATFVWYPAWAGVHTGKEPVGEEEAG